MSALASSAVALHAHSEQSPSVPAWFAELAVLARHFAQRGILGAIAQQVQLARGRTGHYDVIDFVALLLGYAVSGEPTLEAFFDRMAPFAAPYMALFGRDRRPHRSTLSRFLAAVEAPALAALRRLFAEDLQQHGCCGERLGGLVDRQGHRVLVFDVDATRQAVGSVRWPRATTCRRPVAGWRTSARQATPVANVVRSCARTTILQAHTQEWLGTFAGAGNGDYSLELEAACQAVCAYLLAKGRAPADGLLRLDGLYGTATPLARVQSYGLGFLARGRDYQVLDHPAVQARLQHPADLALTHPETRVCREVFDVGAIAEWIEPVPGLPLRCRVVVTRRAAPARPEDVSVGKLVGDVVYELFLTSQPTAGLTAADLIDLYNQRGAFEQALSDEDAEQEPDRWCSHPPSGQEFWQVLSQWIWNLRLEFGAVAQEPPLRWTPWDDGAPISPPTTTQATEPPSNEPADEQAITAVYGPLEC